MTLSHCSQRPCRPAVKKLLLKPSKHYVHAVSFSHDLCRACLLYALNVIHVCLYALNAIPFHLVSFSFDIVYFIIPIIRCLFEASLCYLSSAFTIMSRLFQ